MNRMTAGDDDDDENKWDKNVTDYTKQTNFVFMTPDGNSVTIRLPYGYNVFCGNRICLVGRLSLGGRGWWEESPRRGTVPKFRRHERF